VNLQLITLSGVKYSSDAYSVVLPTASGQITVMPNHEPLLSVLIPGVITIRKNKADSDVDIYATYGGVAEITPEQTRILVDEADADETISESEAEKAHAEAQKLLKEAKSQVELDHAQSLVDRQAVRLQVSSLKRRHQSRR
jgi:F-type H+-transporting ATPase subunit epsilon